MNSLEAYKNNPHSIYENSSYQMSCSINLLEFGKFQFNSAFIIANLDRLKILCETCGPRNHPTEDQVKDFVINGLIDSIKISICFENFGKSILLAKGYLVHLLDKNIFPDLAKKQKNQPVFIEDWAEEVKIKTSSPLELAKNGLLINTINYSTMLNSNAYVKECLYDEEFLEFLKEINSARNHLHLQNSLSFILRDDTFKRYDKLNGFVNTKFENYKNQFLSYLDPDTVDSKPSFIIKLNKKTK